MESVEARWRRSAVGDIPSTNTPRTLDALRLLLRFWRLIRSHHGRLARGAVLSIVASIGGLSLPLLSKVLFDDALPARNISVATVLLLATAAVSLGNTVISTLQSIYAHVVGSRMANELSLHLTKHLLELPARFFDARRTGEVTSRMGDLQQASSFLTSTLQSLLVSLVYFLLVPPILFFVEWRLAVLSLVALPFTFTVSMLAGRVQRRLASVALDLSAEVNGVLLESLAHVRSLKMLGAEAAVADHLLVRAKELHAVQRKAFLLTVGVNFVNTVIRSCGSLAYGLYGWQLLVGGDISLGTFLAFGAYLGYLTGPVSQILGLFTSLQQVAVSLGRVFEYLDEPKEEGLRDSELSPRARLAGSPVGFAFKNVNFGYSDSNVVLHDVSIEAGVGVTALVGSSGSGKSSIVRLLLRLYERQSGVILLHGIPFEQLLLADIRSSVCCVTQEHALFRGTVRQNLLLGLSDVDDGAVYDALETVRLREFVDASPSGLDTMISENGVSLSAGQRQRFAVARALLRRPTVLVLDEATSCLDPDTEQDMIGRIMLSCAGACVFVITHRIETIRQIPRIYFAGEGRVSGGCSHEQLLAQVPAYARMVSPEPIVWGEVRPFGRAESCHSPALNGRRA